VSKHRVPDEADEPDSGVETETQSDDENPATVAEGPPRPVLRIVRGEPSAEDLAVLTALLSAVTGGDEPAPAPAPVKGRWNDPAHTHRRSWSAGPGAWRSAY
jgi:hypothetical protein